MALSVGFEPTTDRLTADSSTVELTEHSCLIIVTNNILKSKYFFDFLFSMLTLIVSATFLVNQFQHL